MDHSEALANSKFSSATFGECQNSGAVPVGEEVEGVSEQEGLDVRDGVHAGGVRHGLSFFPGLKKSSLSDGVK